MELHFEIKGYSIYAYNGSNTLIYIKRIPEDMVYFVIEKLGIKWTKSH